MILDKLRENADLLSKTRELAMQRAHAAGVPVYYMDPSKGDAIIEHHPDGTLRVIEASEDTSIRRTKSR